MVHRKWSCLCPLFVPDNEWFLFEFLPIIPKKATPPTTPPAIAPVFVLPPEPELPVSVGGIIVKDVDVMV